MLRTIIVGVGISASRSRGAAVTDGRRVRGRTATGIARTGSPSHLRARKDTHWGSSAGYGVATSTPAASLRSGAGRWFLVTARSCASQDAFSRVAGADAGRRGFAGAGFGEASIRPRGLSVRRIEPRRRLAVNPRPAGSASVVGVCRGGLSSGPVQDVEVCRTDRAGEGVHSGLIAGTACQTCTVTCR
jgi:hypothetical protein